MTDEEFQKLNERIDNVVEVFKKRFELQSEALQELNLWTTTKIVKLERHTNRIQGVLNGFRQLLKRFKDDTEVNEV